MISSFPTNACFMGDNTSCTRRWPTWPVVIDSCGTERSLVNDKVPPHFRSSQECPVTPVRGTRQLPGERPGGRADGPVGRRPISEGFDRRKAGGGCNAQ